MCLNTDAPANSSTTAAAAAAAAVGASTPKEDLKSVFRKLGLETTHPEAALKKSASDTRLTAHCDVDDYEDYDAFYVPDDDDDTTTLGDTADFDLYDAMSQQDSASASNSNRLLLVDACPPTPLSKKDRNVSFGSLSELSFPVIQGHRSTEISYPMTLGWDLLDQSTQSIDSYEEEREGQRRPYEELRIESKEERKQILADSKKAHKQFTKRKQQERRGLARSNSMANGMMFGRDKRRNRVQEFVGRLKAGMK
jgi:hypothetical protein